MDKSLEKTTSVGSDFRWLNACASRSFTLIALIFFMAVMGARSPSASPKPPAAPSRHEERAIKLHEDRVTKLIVQMADQASLSSDTAFAVREQAQAGLLLWPYERAQARAIWRRAFQTLLRSPVDFQPASALEAARRQQLRVEFLNQVADRDPGMAETLARSFVLPQSANESTRQTVIEGALPWVAVQGRLEGESRELLMSVALRLAEVDKQRAVGLARLSLAAGISPYFDRLLLRIGESDPKLARQLFASAVDYLERTRRGTVGEVHTLSCYLVSTVSAANTDQSPQAEIVRFLDLACDLLMGGAESQAEAASRDMTDSSFQLACTGKYLKELLPRYLPARAAQLQARLAELTDQSTSGQPTSGPAINLSAASSVDPGALEQAARNSADEGERDALYAKAAFAWLARAELQDAQRAAASIANREMRDRLLLVIARRLLSKAAIKEALRIAPLLTDRVAKTGLLIKLADAALAAGDRAGAKTLLDLAGLEAAKIEGPLARARTMLAVVAGFSAFDPVRAFAAMEEAVKPLNETARTDELFELSFADSLTALARFDFDRALLLAQQLNGKELSVIAGLAVCEGGLRPEAAQLR